MPRRDHSTPRIYAGPAVAWPGRPRGYLVVTGTEPEVELLFHRHHMLHDHALWMLKIKSTYQRWSPWPWVAPPPRIWRMDFLELGPASGPIAWLITAWTIWNMVRRG